MDSRRFLSLFALLLMLGAGGLAQAQDRLTLFTPVTGTIRSGETESWTLQAAEGGMLSFHLRATSGDLDPVLEVRSGSSVLVRNDDYQYPESGDALLQSVTIPRTGSYTVTVSGYGDTAGDYELVVLAGFATLALQETFEDESRWSSEGDALEMVTGDNRIALIVAGAQERGLALYQGDETQGSQYIHVEIPEISGPQGWTVGLAARQQASGDYYLYSLNERGQWRFSLRTGDNEQVLRDWSEHPAIIAGQTTFSLGLLVNEGSFEFFYDGHLVGRLTDTTLAEPHQVGLMAESAPTAGSEVTAQFQNLVITTPLDDAPAPQNLLSSGQTAVVQELQRHRLIPAEGSMGLVVPESFVTFNRPGVNELLLGGSQTFRTFALGTTITWEISTPNLAAGCGLVLRSDDEDHYLLAYLDQTGAYGLAQREGDHFEPGIYGEGLALADGPQRLVVIGHDDALMYYINGQLVGRLESAATAGAIGNAVVNFDPTITSCQFQNTWVWNWDTENAE